MHPQHAKDMIARQLPSQEVQHHFIQQGHASCRDCDGAEYFLWVPDNEPNLYLYGHLADLTPEVSGQLLARALALNLEHTATFRAAISLNLQTHQLLLRDTQEVKVDLNVNLLLSEFSARASDLRRRLKYPADPACSPDQTHSSVGPNPISWNLQSRARFNRFQS